MLEKTGFWLCSNVNNMAVKTENSWLDKERLREFSHVSVTLIKSHPEEKLTEGVGDVLTRQGNDGLRSDKNESLLAHMYIFNFLIFIQFH